MSSIQLKSLKSFCENLKLLLIFEEKMRFKISENFFICVNNCVEHYDGNQTSMSNFVIRNSIERGNKAQSSEDYKIHNFRKFSNLKFKYKLELISFISTIGFKFLKTSFYCPTPKFPSSLRGIKSILDKLLHMVLVFVVIFQKVFRR